MVTGLVFNKTKKICMVFILLISITTVCFAAGYEIDPDRFAATYDIDISTAKSLGEKILGYIVNIAAISSVIIIAFLGLKFMIGSVEQRAEYKKSFMPLIIGMFVVLASSSIVGIMFDFEGTTSCNHDGFSNEGARCRGDVCNLCGFDFTPREHSWVDGVCKYCHIKEHSCEWVESSDSIEFLDGTTGKYVQCVWCMKMKDLRGHNIDYISHLDGFKIR